jgi:hypothetical protein
MKKLITTTILALTITSAAYAAEDTATKDTMKGSGMMQGDMMKNCQSHMKDGKMMDSMPKDMMAKCQDMMKDGGMMKGGMIGDMKKPDATATDTSKPADDADDEKHHPKQ